MKRPRKRRFKLFRGRWLTQAWIFMANLQTVLLVYYFFRSRLDELACSACGGKRGLVLSRTDGSTQKSGPGRYVKILNALPDDVGVRCRSCVSRKAARRSTWKRRVGAKAPEAPQEQVTDDAAPATAASPQAVTRVEVATPARPAPQPSPPQVEDDHEELAAFQHAHPVIAARLRRKHGPLVSARRDLALIDSRVVQRGWVVTIADGRMVPIPGVAEAA